jgi:hypothetical protein
VQLVEAKAYVDSGEKSREATTIEAFKQSEDHHTQQFKNIYLDTKAKRKTFALEGS